MHQTVTAPVAASPERVASIISDLASYPDWLDLVTAAAPSASDDDAPAWLVTIRAKVGPFARSKKLRMVRTVAEQTGDVSTYRFERREVDGRDHSAWTLDAAVTSHQNSATTSEVTMSLRYDGGLWTAPLEPILGSFISGAGADLEAYANRT
jgi:hypothetical protein